MGGRAQRKKVRQMIWLGILGGMSASALMAVILYLLSRFPQAPH
jgi:hypothetical protein